MIYNVCSICWFIFKCLRCFSCGTDHMKPAPFGALYKRLFSKQKWFTVSQGEWIRQVELLHHFLDGFKKCGEIDHKISQLYVVSTSMGNNSPEICRIAKSSSNVMPLERQSATAKSVQAIMISVQFGRNYHESILKQNNARSCLKIMNLSISPLKSFS